MDYAFYNGKFAPYDEITLRLSDRSVFFGDGVYECMIGKCGGIFEWHEHIERLKNGLHFIGIDFSDFKLLRETADKLISLSEYERYTVYIQLSRKAERRIHSPAVFGEYNLLLTVTELADFNDKEISLITKEDRRYRLCNIKTLNLLPAVLASHEASLKKADECVFLRDGVVTECAHSNLFILKRGVLFTHPTGEFILPGITRASLIEEAEKSGIGTVECEFGKAALFSADEVLITSSTRLVRRVREIDGRTLKMNDANNAKRLIGNLRSNFINFCC